jgi:CheY-like chemotaxis protein
MHPNHILLVDDSTRDTEMTIDALQQYHVMNPVVTLRDGVEALDYLYRRGQYAARPETYPAVILLDLKMPRLDGLGVLREIKANPRLKVIPIVMMTSSREERTWWPATSSA